MKKSFTLIELMIVIAILGILATLISGNFITSLKKGRDARRKTDLEQIQRALEMYYEDKKAYPTASAVSPGFVYGSAFADPVSGKTYMQKVGNDPQAPAKYYQYQSDGTYYRMFSYIENDLDQGAGVSKTGFTEGPNCSTSDLCRFTISSTNITPLPPR